MVSTGVLSWPAVATLGAAAGCAYLTRVAWRYTGRPGGELFLGTAAGMTGVAVLNGTALLIADPAIREAVVLATLIVGFGAALSWFGFGLAYTGRSAVLSTPLFGVVGTLVAVLAAVVVTNPVHGAVWQEFRVVETAGALGATVEPGVGLFAAYLVLAVLLVAPIAVLLESFLRFGSPYRRQTIALSLTPLFPGMALTAWVFDLGPVPALNLVGLFLLPHMLLDVYALSAGRLFVLSPSTRHIGERTALDELATPVIVVNEKYRLIALNGAAEELLELEDPVGTALNDLLTGDRIDPAREDPASVTLETTAGWRTFDIDAASLSEDVSGRLIGYTITLTDITGERRREQRLEVLNRVLRHNLRNDLHVVTGYAESIQIETDDEQLLHLADRIHEASGDLIALADRARTIDELLDRRLHPEVVPLAELLEETATRLRAEHSNARVVVDAGETLRLRTDPALLGVAVEAAAEHALTYNDRSEPTLCLSATARNGEDGDSAAVAIHVDDDGEGPPVQEHRPIERGRETKLDHATGIDHWLAAWTVEYLGGTISYGVDEATVELRVSELAAGAGELA